MRLEDLPEEYGPLSAHVLHSAIEVHRALGPGLLEHSHRECMAHELRLRGFDAVTEQEHFIQDKRLVVPRALRADVVVENKIVVELKCVPKLQPEHERKLLTYMRNAHFRLGFAFNFHAPLIKEDHMRRVL